MELMAKDEEDNQMQVAGVIPFLVTDQPDSRQRPGGQTMLTKAFLSPTD